MRARARRARARRARARRILELSGLLSTVGVVVVEAAVGVVVVMAAVAVRWSLVVTRVLSRYDLSPDHMETYPSTRTARTHMHKHIRD